MTEKEMIFSKDRELVALGSELFRQDHTDDECKEYINELFEEYLFNDSENDKILTNAIYELSNRLPDTDISADGFKNTVDYWRHQEEELLKRE